VTTIASTQIGRRIQGFCQRAATHSLFRRPLTIDKQKPIISFTFDDFPDRPADRRRHPRGFD
jgi:hypothetical protein